MLLLRSLRLASGVVEFIGAVRGSEKEPRSEGLTNLDSSCMVASL